MTHTINLFSFKSILAAIASVVVAAASFAVFSPIALAGHNCDAGTMAPDQYLNCLSTDHSGGGAGAAGSDGRTVPRQFDPGLGEYQSVADSGQFESYGNPASGPLSAQNILDIITEIRNFLIVLGIIVVVIFVIWGGVDYISSRGDEAKVEAAKQKIIVAVIGAAIILMVFILLQTLRAVIEQRTIFTTGDDVDLNFNQNVNL